jgi:hypothetical protein
LRRGGNCQVLLLVSLAGCRAPGPRAEAAVEIAVLEQSEAIVGRDGGQSALLWDRSVWIYGDTVLSIEDEWGRTWHHNSFSITEDLDASDGIGGFVEPLDPAGAPLHLIPPTSAEKAFNEAHWEVEGSCAEQPCGARWAVWPGSPVWDAEGERALVFYGLIYAEPGDFNFESVGASIAIWTDPEGLPERPVIDPDAAHPDLLWRAGEPGWGVISVIVDGRLHTFACDGDDGPGHDCRLARVELADIHDRGAWRYWTGSSWSADMSEVEVLFEGAPIMSVAYNEFLGEWLAIYSSPFSSKIVGRTAPELVGPWSREGVLYDAGEDEPYDVVAHPEYEEESGRVQILSYSRPTGGWFGTEFPLVRVELEG